MELRANGRLQRFSQINHAINQQIGDAPLGIAQSTDGETGCARGQSVKNPS